MLTSGTLRGAVTLGVVTALAFVPSAVAAGAGTILGPADPSGGTNPVQGINYTGPPVLVNTIAPNGVPLAAPADGVITSWTVYFGQVSTVGATVKLRVLTRNGALDGNAGGSFTFANSGPAEPIALTPPATVSVKHTFNNQHIPIKAGQYPAITVLRDPTGTFIVRLPAVDGYRFAQLQQDGGFADGETRTLAGYSGQFAAYNAQFERDADRDRFGDSTQDKCVAYAGTFSGCVTKMTASKTVVKRGKKVRFTVLGAKAGSKYAIRLGSGRLLTSGKVPQSGKVVRLVKIPKSAKAKRYNVVFKTAKPKERTSVRLTVRR